MFLFLHLPKTAGTTLRVLLEEVYGKDRIFETYAYDSMTETADAFHELGPARKADLRVVAGHFGYGLHEALEGDHSYLTFLREPVERVVSTYYHMRNLPGDHWHIRQRRLSLRDFIESGSTMEVDNGMTRILSGVGPVGGLGGCPQEALVTAQNNLVRDFACIGLTESFDESLVLMSKKLGWSRVPLYLRQNVSAERPSLTAVSGDDMAAIQEHCRLDIRLYEFAQELYRSEVAAQGPGFASEVRRYSDALADMAGILEAEHERWKHENSPLVRMTRKPLAGLSEVRRRLGLRTRLMAFLASIAPAVKGSATCMRD